MIQVKDWNIEAMTGYHPLTTLYTDFEYAEAQGRKAITAYYKEVKEQLLSDLDNMYKEFTELVMVLNWKIWEHSKTNEALSQLYEDLWREADMLAQDRMNDDQLNYFYRTTD